MPAIPLMKSRAFLLFVATLSAGLIAADKPVTDHSKLTSKEAKANAANWPDNSKGSPTPHAPAENPPAATTQRSQQVAPPGPAPRKRPPRRVRRLPPLGGGHEGGPARRRNQRNSAAA